MRDLRFFGTIPAYARVSPSQYRICNRRDSGFHKHLEALVWKHIAALQALG